MSLFHRKLILLFLIVLPFPIRAQIISSEDYRKSVDTIANLFKSISGTQSENEKIACNGKIVNIFKQLLSEPKSFTYSFDTLKNVGHIVAPDKSFRIINWNLPLLNGTHRYFCFLQVNQQSTVQLFELTDRSEEIPKPENAVLYNGDWYGGLYYKILRNEVKDKVYYTLLELQYHNFFITRKIIDVLYFDQLGNPAFGAPIFEVESKMKKRVVFEYSAKSGMNLRYDDKLQMIVFDHLVPSQSAYTGQYEYYSPDLTFDGFKFLKDHWIFKSNLDIRRPDQPHR